MQPVWVTVTPLTCSVSMKLRTLFIVSRAPAAIPQVPMATITWMLPGVAFICFFCSASSRMRFSSSRDLMAGIVSPLLSSYSLQGNGFDAFFENAAHKCEYFGFSQGDISQFAFQFRAFEHEIA